MGNERDNLVNIKFFSDKPLDIDREQEVQFGHLGIVNNLKKIISICPIPFTIGLFGKWGCGKTSILNILENKLKQEKNRIAVVSFDVWKHEGDSFRRTFLKDIVQQLKKDNVLSENYQISERLDKTITTEKQFKKFSLNWKNWLFLIIIIGIFIGTGYYLYNNFPGVFVNFVTLILSGSILSSIIIWIIKQLIITDKITTSSDKLKDPHEFESEFKKIVDTIKINKILVIIDNLDRCNHKQAVALLSTIKTFLAKDRDDGTNKCIFLIACDDDAIKKHIKYVYTKENIDNTENDIHANEFLRKFFNTYIRIPNFINTELQTYTEKLVNDVGISQFNTPEVADVITIAYRENPRQIKQFINILTSHFILANERENGHEKLIIPKGVITNNIAFLAKLLIIRQKFPLEYNKIGNEYLTVDEIEKTENIELKEFLQATKTITVDEIRPFIYFKQSKEELLISSIKEIELGLLENKIDILREKFKQLRKDINQIKHLQRYILSLINTNKGRKNTIFNITNSSLDAIHFNNIKFDQNFYDKIADLLSSILKDQIERFEPSLIFSEIIDKCKHKKVRNSLIESYIYILSKHKNKADRQFRELNEQEALKIFRGLLTYKNLLNKDQISKIEGIINDLYADSTEIIALFANNAEGQKEFLSEETIKSFTNFFTDEDVDSKTGILRKTDLLLQLKHIIGNESIKNIIISFNTLLSNEIKNPYRAEKEDLIFCIKSILIEFRNILLGGSDKTFLNDFANTIVKGIKSFGDWNERKSIIFVCIKIVDLIDDPHKQNINNLIIDFYSNAGLENLKFIFVEFNKKEIEIEIEKYSDIFQKKALKNQQFFDYLYPLAPNYIRIQWLKDLIISDNDRAIIKLKEINYNLDDKKGIVDTLLKVVIKLPIDKKQNVYEAINKMNCGNDSLLREEYAQQMALGQNSITSLSK